MPQALAPPALLPAAPAARRGCIGSLQHEAVTSDRDDGASRRGCRMSSLVFLPCGSARPVCPRTGRREQTLQWRTCQTGTAGSMPIGVAHQRAGNAALSLRPRAPPAVRPSGFRGPCSTVPESLRNDVRPTRDRSTLPRIRPASTAVDVPARPLQPQPLQPQW